MRHVFNPLNNRLSKPRVSSTHFNAGVFRRCDECLTVNAAGFSSLSVLPNQILNTEVFFCCSVSNPIIAFFVYFLEKSIGKFPISFRLPWLSGEPRNLAACSLRICSGTENFPLTIQGNISTTNYSIIRPQFNLSGMVVFVEMNFDMSIARFMIVQFVGFTHFDSPFQ